MRRRKKPGAKEELLRLSPPLVLEPKLQREKWQEYFGNPNPIHIELGMGKGRFITTLAKNNPQLNYLGLEIKEEVILAGVKKAVDEKLENLAFIWGDVKELLEYFSLGAIQRIYINFCDPWPKARWINRRLTYRGFLKLYGQLLAPAGQLFFKTDNPQLFEFTLKELSQEGWLLEQVYLDLYANPPDDNVATEYELKFVEQGLRIYHLVATSANLQEK